MTRFLLIFNPSANHGLAGQLAADLRAMIDTHGGADWRGTEYPGHAKEIAMTAAAQGYDVVVALGGDGTVHEVVNGLLGVPSAQRPALGIVPIGSGNDFAGGVGLPANPQEAMRRVLEGQPRPVDVARITDASGRFEYFINTCGVGLDGDINIASRGITFVHGFWMYFLAVLQSVFFSYQSQFMRITHDGGVIEEGVMMLTVGNGNREGGGFKVTPDAQPDDGLLDVAFINQVSRLRILQLIPLVMQGAHGKEPDVRLFRTTRLSITGERAIPIHIDGEMFAPYEADVRAVNIEIVPGAVQLVR